MVRCPPLQSLLVAWACLAPASARTSRLALHVCLMCVFISPFFACCSCLCWCSLLSSVVRSSPTRNEAASGSAFCIWTFCYCLCGSAQLLAVPACHVGHFAVQRELMDALILSSEASDGYSFPDTGSASLSVSLPWHQVLDQVHLRPCCFSRLGIANLRFVCALRSARVVFLSGIRRGLLRHPACTGVPLSRSVPETADHAETRGVREASTGDDVHLITDHAVLWPVLHRLCW